MSNSETVSLSCLDGCDSIQPYPFTLTQAGGTGRGGGCGAQNFFTYFYGAVFNLMGLAAMYAIDGGVGPTLLQGHNTVTVMLIVNNAAQGILSSFFFKVRAPTHSTLGACWGGGKQS